MKDNIKLFLMRFIRSILMILCVLSLFDLIENSKFVQNCPGYATYKYLLLTKISLSITIVSSIFGIMKRLTGFTNKFHSFLMAAAPCLETIVFILFWGLLFFDKKMIVDPNAVKNNSEASLWNRICSHTIPFFLSYLNMHDLKLNYDNRHVVFFVMFGIIYYLATTLYSIRFQREVYPFLYKLTYAQKAFVFFGIDILAISIYLINLRIFSKKNKKLNLNK
jgi:hypothetical protein